MVNRQAQDDALLKDLARRSWVAVALSFPIAIMIAVLHRHQIPLPAMLTWLCAMVILQSSRLIIAHRFTSGRTANKSARFWKVVFTGIAILAGLLWGSCLFILDTGNKDFLFLFKFLGLAAILGTALNSLSVVFEIYAGFVVSTAAMMLTYILGFTPFLNQEDRVSLVVGTTLYAIYLLSAGSHVQKMARLYFHQGFEREEALSKLNEAHESEKTLRKMLEFESQKLVEMNQQLQKLARQDALTGVDNRRSLMERISREILQSDRYGSAFSVILLDVDKFKSINDTYGHQVGDQVLIGVSRTMKNQLRNVDTFGRWGGEEFLCILYQTPFESAMICSERLRRSIEQQQLLTNNPAYVVTASFGVATHRRGETLSTLIDRVDAQLYSAKTTGRNRAAGEP